MTWSTANWILPDYFRVMGIPLRTGRDLNDADAQAQARAVIVNETFARQLSSPARSAVGRRVRLPAPEGQELPWAEIVGVVADSRYMTLGEETKPQVYWPLGPQLGRPSRSTCAARATRARWPQPSRRAGRGRSRGSVLRVRPLQAVMAVALFPAQAAAVVLAALGLVGWALTVAGVYGLVAYTVARRIPEIGLRVALGATSASVMRLLLRDGLVDRRRRRGGGSCRCGGDDAVPERAARGRGSARPDQFRPGGGRPPAHGAGGQLRTRASRDSTLTDRRAPDRVRISGTAQLLEQARVLDARGGRCTR